MENSIVKDVEKIINDSIKIYELGGKTFTNANLERVITKDKAREIVFNDLSSIVELLKNELERFEKPLYVNIESYNKVSVFSSMDTEKDREIPYSAKIEQSNFRFSSWYNYEDFVIAIRSQFVESADSKDLLQLIKKVSKAESVELEDDGITQKVKAENGVSLNWGVTTKPIVTLTPYRTFIEVEQPESEFLFRVRDNSFALFEADGGAWKIKAKQNIRKFFNEKLKKEIDAGSVVIVG